MLPLAYKQIRRLYTEYKESKRTGGQGSEAELEYNSNTEWVEGAPRDAAPRTNSTLPVKRFLTLAAALCIPVFLESLDYTVVATTQPEIASAFNQLSLQSYISTIYLLTSTVFLPLFASVAHVYGRYSGLQVSLIIFIFGSALCTGAQNLETLLVGRGISGIGAAGLLALGRIILADTTSLDENNWQATLLSALYFPGFTIGPYLGGALIKLSYRWIFGINIPLCLAAMLLSFLLLRKTTKGPQPPRSFHEIESYPVTTPTNLDRLLYIDWIGALVFAIGGILLLLGLNWGSANDWNDVKTVVSLVIGTLLIIGCLFWEFVLERVQTHMAENPLSGLTRSKSRVWTADALLPLAIFRSYDVSAAEFAALTSGMVLLVVFYIVAIFSTIVSGQSASSAGVQLLYFAPGLGAGTSIANRLIAKFRQPKYPIILGTFIIPITLGLLSWATQRGNQTEINVFLAIAGVGVGATFGPLAVHARFSQPPDRAPIVVALNLFFRSLGGTIGLVQCFTILNSKVTSYLVSHASSIPDGSILGSLSVASLSSVQAINDLPSDVQVIVRAAFQEGVRYCFLSLVPWCCLSFIGTLFLSNIADEDREPSIASGGEGGESVENVQYIDRR